MEHIKKKAKGGKRTVTLEKGDGNQKVAGDLLKKKSMPRYLTATFLLLIFSDLLLTNINISMHSRGHMNK